MTPLLRCAALRRLEAAQPPGESLMSRAGRAIAEHAARMKRDSGAPIVVVAGPGNNGGDAWLAALRLQEAFHRVAVVDAATAEPTSPEAVEAMRRFAQLGGTVGWDFPEGTPALVVDGLLGLGLARDVTGRFAELIARINASGAPVLAIDVPSGLDADTGRIRGDAVRATRTLTFLAAKPGLHTGEGLDCAGDVVVDTLGVDPGAEGTLLEPADVRPWLARRSRNAHKGTFGTLGIVGGSRGMVGAAILAGRAGLYTGAGKVLVGLLTPEGIAYDPGAPELMIRPIDDALEAGVLVVGCGAGVSPTATSRSPFERSVLPACVNAEKPLVLDADALNALAVHKALQPEVSARLAPTILTPHPGEAARLLGIPVEQVQADRIGAALALAERFRAEVVLKGAGSIFASPDASWSINATGNPGLASGGTGDVLAGAIGALLCQGLPAAQALRYAVCLHGAAADACVEAGLGPAGLTASDVIEAMRILLNTWTGEVPR